MSYLIKPTNTITGAMAPGIISYCERKEDAIAEAKSRSRLSIFDNWNFSFEVIHIRDKEVKKRKYYEED